MNLCTHFVGFRGDEYHNAVKTFGEPDFIHRFFDPRAKAEFMEGDRVIFANETENKFTIFSFDDSKFF